MEGSGFAEAEGVGVVEIARYYAISKQLADGWTRRRDFPAPMSERSARGGRQWDPELVIAWGVKHGRRRGCGPGG